MPVADASNPRQSRRRQIYAVIAVLDHVMKDTAAYAEPRPVAQVLDSIRNMPTNSDADALLDELQKLRMFRIEIGHHVAMLVSAEETPLFGVRHHEHVADLASIGKVRC
jgi:hypothetical protein